MAQPIKTAILISGRGSNMIALLEAAQQPDYPTEFALVISNKAGAQGIEHAQKFGISTKIIEHKNFETRELFESTLHDELIANGIQLVALAGFMRVLTPWFIARWKNRLINIHPALLPAFPGLDTHRRALEAGVQQHGCTVHFVDEGVDTGKIIGQASVPVHKEDTEATLAARVLTAEHKLYPAALQHLCKHLQQASTMVELPVDISLDSFSITL